MQHKLDQFIIILLCYYVILFFAIVHHIMDTVCNLFPSIVTSVSPSTSSLKSRRSTLRASSGSSTASLTKETPTHHHHHPKKKTQGDSLWVYDYYHVRLIMYFIIIRFVKSSPSIKVPSINIKKVASKYFSLSHPLSLPLVGS